MNSRPAQWCSLCQVSHKGQPKVLASLLFKARSRNHVNMGLSPFPKGPLALTGGKLRFPNSDWCIADHTRQSLLFFSFVICKSKPMQSRRHSQSNALSHCNLISEDFGSPCYFPVRTQPARMPIIWAQHILPTRVPRGMERRQSTIGSLPGFLQIHPDIGVGLWVFECLLWDAQDMLDQGAG